MTQLRVLDLFSGIGGFSLGLERAGMKTVAFCEIEPYCRAVLRKHWPHVPIYHDVRELTGEKLRADGIVADVICGGFPCQDISIAYSSNGKRRGLDGERSGLFYEIIRIVREIRPAAILLENVSAVIAISLGQILGVLAESGYDAEWRCIPASKIGCVQVRDRCWILAYPHGSRVQGSLQSLDLGAYGQGWPCSAEDILSADPFAPGHCWPQPLLRGMDEWPSYWSHRIKSLGNSVVPQIPEIIGRAIVAAQSELRVAA